MSGFLGLVTFKGSIMSKKTGIRGKNMNNPTTQAKETVKFKRKSTLRAMYTSA